MVILWFRNHKITTRLNRRGSTGGGGFRGFKPPPPPWAAQKTNKKKGGKKGGKKKKKRKKKERTLERNPFKCKYCEKIFNSSGNLTKHMITLDITVYLTVTWFKKTLSCTAFYGLHCVNRCQENITYGVQINTPKKNRLAASRLVDDALHRHYFGQPPPPLAKS